MVDFNMQKFLSEMRAETLEGQRTLGNKIDEIKEVLSEHDKRITVVENSRKTARWILGAAGTAMLPVAYDVIVNHFFK